MPSNAGVFRLSAELSVVAIIALSLCTDGSHPVFLRKGSTLNFGLQLQHRKRMGAQSG